MKSIRAKKSFTLIELIIVVFLISIAYFLMFSSSSFDIKEDKVKLNLENIKEYLLENFEFQNELAFICIEDKLTCFIRIDGVYDDELKIENFFQNLPEVYELNQDELKVEFFQTKINDINYNPVFELKINSDFKTNEFIIDKINDKVYVFNSIFKKPQVYKDLREAFEVFYNNEIEVRDAF